MKNVHRFWGTAAVCAACLFTDGAGATTKKAAPAGDSTQALQHKVDVLEGEVAALRRQVGALQAAHGGAGATQAPKAVVWDNSTRAPMTDRKQVDLQAATDCSLSHDGASNRVLVGYENGRFICAQLALQ